MSTPTAVNYYDLDADTKIDLAEALTAIQWALMTNPRRVPDGLSLVQATYRHNVYVRLDADTRVYLGWVNNPATSDSGRHWGPRVSRPAPGNAVELSEHQTRAMALDDMANYLKNIL